MAVSIEETVCTKVVQTPRDISPVVLSRAPEQPLTYFCLQSLKLQPTALRLKKVIRIARQLLLLRVPHQIGLNVDEDYLFILRTIYLSRDRFRPVLICFF